MRASRIEMWNWLAERMMDVSRWFSKRADALEERALEIERLVEGNALFEEISASIQSNPNWRNGRDTLLYLKENDRIVYAVGLQSFTISRGFRQAATLYGTSRAQQKQILEWISRTQKDDV
jgi:hypothetical protein